MPGSQRGRRAAKEVRHSRLEDLLAAVQDIHLAVAGEAGEGNLAADRIGAVAGEEHHNRLAVPEGAGPTENSCQ